MPPDPQPRQGPPIGTIILLVLSGLAYATLLMLVPQVSEGGSYIGLLLIFFVYPVLIVLWALLAILLIIAGVKGAMPGWAIALAAFGHPLSAASAGWSLFVLADRAASSPLPFLVVFVAPPLLALFALWARLPQSHGTFPPQATSAGLLVPVLVLSLAQMIDQAVVDARRAAEAKAAQQAYEAEQARRERERKEQNLARFNRLTDASPLPDWAEFIGKGNELEKPAIERARALPHRQPDAEAMLAAGDAFPLHHFEALRLAATPQFCTATGDFLTRQAADRSPTAESTTVYHLSNGIEPLLPTLRWLIGQGCNLDAAVEAVENAAIAYPAMPARETFLNQVVELRSGWSACNGMAKLSAERRLAACDALIASGQPTVGLLASAYFERGGAHYDAGGFDAAIADYGEAIARKPDFAAAFNNRGNAFDSKGDVDAALRDYDEALRLKPDFVIASSNRGLLHVEKGELDLAVADFDAALAQRPDYADARRNRGRTLFLKGDFAGAVSDLEAAHGLKRRDASVVLWLYLARSRSGMPARDKLRGEANALDPDAWPRPIVSAYLGETEATAALAAAEAGDAAGRTERACEARFYLGEGAVVERQVAAARNLLQEAAKTCPAGSAEGAAARLELARLGG